MAVTKRPTLQDIGDNPVIIEKKTGAIIPAGNIVELNSSDYLINHATAGAICPVIVAVEDGVQVADETESYASGELAKSYVVQTGRKAYFNLADGEVAVIGSKLASKGDGTLRVADVAVAASGTSGVEGSNNGITYTAVTAGSDGNLIEIALIDPSANSQSLTVTNYQNYIAISLATDGGGAITSTAAEVIAAVNAVPGIVVSADDTGTSTGAAVVAAVSAFALTGGSDADNAIVNAMEAVTASGSTAKILGMAR